jgi:hypothetical protein
MPSAPSCRTAPRPRLRRRPRQGSPREASSSWTTATAHTGTAPSSPPPGAGSTPPTASGAPPPGPDDGMREESRPRIPPGGRHCPKTDLCRRHSGRAPRCRPSAPKPALPSPPPPLRGYQTRRASRPIVGAPGIQGNPPPPSIPRLPALRQGKPTSPTGRPAAGALIVPFRPAGREGGGSGGWGNLESDPNGRGSLPGNRAIGARRARPELHKEHPGIVGVFPTIFPKRFCLLQMLDFVCVFIEGRVPCAVLPIFPRHPGCSTVPHRSPPHPTGSARETGVLWRRCHSAFARTGVRVAAVVAKMPWVAKKTQ